MKPFIRLNKHKGKFKHIGEKEHTIFFFLLQIEANFIWLQLEKASRYISYISNQQWEDIKSLSYIYKHI